MQDGIEHNYAKYDSFSKFLYFSNNGPLVQTSRSVYRIVCEIEKQIKLLTNNFLNLNIKNLDVKVITKVKNLLTLDNLIFTNLNCENIDILHIPHKIKLITAISYHYLKIRLYSCNKFYTQEILKPISKRHQLTKQILFRCE